MLHFRKLMQLFCVFWVLSSWEEVANAQKQKEAKVLPTPTGIYAPRKLDPVMEEYSLLRDFQSRNAFAFRFANRANRSLWLQTLVENFSNQKFSGEERQCMAHLCSAMFAKGQVGDFRYFLAGRDAPSTNSVMDILLQSRELKADGSDQVWPENGPFGNGSFREDLARLCVSPNFSEKASEVLSSYGSRGIDVIDLLVLNQAKLV